MTGKARNRGWRVVVLLAASAAAVRAEPGPKRVFALDLPADVRAIDVVASPSRAYVLARAKRDASQVLYVVDATVPTGPVVSGTLVLDRRVSRLVAGHGAAGERLYAGTRGRPSELLVLDVSDGAHPALVSVVPVGRPISALAVHDGRLYLGTRNDRRSDGRELRIFGLSDPDHPVELGGVEIGAHVNDVAVLGAMPVVATSDDEREVVLIDAADAAAAHEAVAIDLPGAAPAVAVATQAPSTVAVVTEGGMPDFHLFDVAAGPAVALRGTARLRAKAARLALRGRWAWVSSRRRGAGLRLVDLSDDAGPRVVRTYAARGVTSLALHGPYAYLASGDPTMDVQIVDPALPLRPEIGDRDGDGVATVACLGDSNTDGSWWPGPTWCEQLALATPTVVTMNGGRGGGTAVDVPDWPYDGPGQLADALTNDRPDVVILAFGTNDVRFAYSVDEVAAAYRDLATRAAQAGAFVLIALTPPVAPWFDEAPALNPLYDLLNARLAVEWPADHLVDFATVASPADEYAEDGLHFTVPGHAKRALAAYSRLVFAD